MDRIALSLAAAPIIFAATAWLTRSPLRRIAGGLAGGVAFAIGNAACDLLAYHAGWWWYAGIDHAPALWYAAAGLAAAGVSFIGWRIYRRHAVRGALVFLVAFGLFCIARDSRAAAAEHSVLQFAEGIGPRIADCVAAIVLMTIALAIQLGLGGDVRALRSRVDQ